MTSFRRSPRNVLQLLSILVLLFCTSTVNAFIASSSSTSIAFTTRQVTSERATATPTKLYFFGQPKDDGTPGDYVCLDCGYVFTKGPKAWADLPSNWSCPPCGSIKRRFKKVPKGSAKTK